jgi:hypothetical protein
MAAARLSATPRAMPPINRIAIMDTRRTPQARRAVSCTGRALSALCRVGYEVFHTTVVPPQDAQNTLARPDDARDPVPACTPVVALPREGRGKWIGEREGKGCGEKGDAASLWHHRFRGCG